MLRRQSLLALPLWLAAPAWSQAPEKPRRAPDVRYEPSTMEISRAMLRLANTGKRDIVYDLGCGDGRIAIAAVKEFGARKAVGIDIDPVRIQESVANARAAGVEGKVTFLNEDLFEADIREATVVTLYLWPWVNLKLKPKLLDQLKPGTRIVSHSHDMGDWKPEKEIVVDGDTIYFWTIPKKSAK